MGHRISRPGDAGADPSTARSSAPPPTSLRMTSIAWLDHLAGLRPTANRRLAAARDPRRRHRASQPGSQRWPLRCWTEIGLNRPKPPLRTGSTHIPLWRSGFRGSHPHALVTRRNRSTSPKPADARGTPGLLTPKESEVLRPSRTYPAPRSRATYRRPRAHYLWSPPRSAQVRVSPYPTRSIDPAHSRPRAPPVAVACARLPVAKQVACARLPVAKQLARHRRPEPTAGQGRLAAMRTEAFSRSFTSNNVFNSLALLMALA
jgi:hypothetical protein